MLWRIEKICPLAEIHPFFEQPVSACALEGVGGCAVLSSLACAPHVRQRGERRRCWGSLLRGCWYTAAGAIGRIVVVGKKARTMGAPRRRPSQNHPLEWWDSRVEPWCGPRNSTVVFFFHVIYNERVQSARVRGVLFAKVRGMWWWWCGGGTDASRTPGVEELNLDKSHVLLDRCRRRRCTSEEMCHGNQLIGVHCDNNVQNRKLRSVLLAYGGF